jgi:PAS domain S-box-containing protein
VRLPRGALAGATAAVIAFLALLESGRMAPHTAQRMSDVLQLLLASGAAAACLLAARRSGASGLWTGFGLGCVAWTVGQLVWLVNGVPSAPESGYPEADLAFVASTALFVAAFVLRPDRRDRRGLLVAIDVGVALFAMLYLFFEIAYVYLLLGELDAYEAWSTSLFNLRGLALLTALLWAVHYADASWKRLYNWVAPCFLLLEVGGAITNRSFTLGVGSYHAGLYDLPWTLPFLWLGLLAAGWSGPAGAPRALAHAGDWPSMRRSTRVAFVTVLLFPVVHILLAGDDAPGSPLARLRAAAALVGTLLVAGLYLARQLIVLRDAESRLREGEERFRALLDTGADGVGVYGPDLSVQYVSGSVMRLSGYRPEERVGRSTLDLVHPDDLEHMRETVRSVLSTPGRRVVSCYRVRTRDGRWRDVETEAVNRLDDPAVAGIVANFRDVTERRRAEEERERSRSLLEATLESTADGILVADLHGHMSRFNEKFCEMWSVTRELLEQGEGRALASVVDQLQEPQAFIDKVRSLYSQPEAESLDTLRFRDGRVYQRYSQPQRLAGEVVGRVWSFTDVSERARAEREAARLVSIIEATPDLVGTADAAGVPLYLNRAGRRLLGLGDHSPLGDDINRYYPAREWKRVTREVLPAAVRHGSWSGEIAVRHRDGHEIPVLQVIVAHRDAAGEVEFLSTIARDIRERKQAEEELRRSQTMAALGALVAGVAHEVRNPLFGIGSTLDAFEARFAGQSDHRPYLHVFRDQLSRLTSLMNDLLEYAKPSGLELALGPIGPVVEQALAACSELAERARVTLESRVAPELPPLRMDPKRLAQVFRNLVENAIQHSPEGRAVRVSVELVSRGGEARLECVVEDQGSGFGAEDLPHVFEPFFTRRHGGTGLGLSIVYRIVSDHGGTIAARNRPGGGARISVSLPVARRPR